MVKLKTLSHPQYIQPIIDATTVPKFINPLPIPQKIDKRKGGKLTITMSEFYQDLGLLGANDDNILLTKVWGYNGTYPGPTILVTSNKKLIVEYHNNLKVLPLLPIDSSIHWAFSHNGLDIKKVGVPLVPHLHGGHTESNSDGLPEQWWTPDLEYTGNYFVKNIYTYDNDQESSILWYHDHTLGITRLNVYAGLSGFYLIQDENELEMIKNNQLPTGPYDIELLIQDRMLYPNGDLAFPNQPFDQKKCPNKLELLKWNQNQPSIQPEFFGDIILVNGKAWPKLDVEPRQYRFRLLNGSDSRFYNLRIKRFCNKNIKKNINDYLSFYIIGSDGGFLDKAVKVTNLLISPSERYDIIVDFSDKKIGGNKYLLTNSAAFPYPKGKKPNPETAGKIMLFSINKSLNTFVYSLTDLPTVLRSEPIQSLAMQISSKSKVRKLLLFETIDKYGRKLPSLGTIDQGILSWDDKITENPKANVVEIWEIYNTTTDAHPIHIHQGSFQILDRQKFEANQNQKNGKLCNIKKIGNSKFPKAYERGWKDTVIANPGEITRIIDKFDLLGRFVWHCHIISHEDHEMMRPFFVRK